MPLQGLLGAFADVKRLLVDGEEITGEVADSCSHARRAQARYEDGARVGSELQRARRAPAGGRSELTFAD